MNKEQAIKVSLYASVVIVAFSFLTCMLWAAWNWFVSVAFGLHQIDLLGVIGLEACLVLLSALYLALKEASERV